MKAWAVPLELNVPATLTGIGSMPGTNAMAAAIRISDQLPDLPHVPELPDRGPGADMIGRTLGLLSQVSPDFSATTTVTGWELSPPGRDMRRARSMLSQDLDATEQAWSGHRGLAKQQVAGPFTIASCVDYRGRRLLADSGIMRDLIAAWKQMVAEHRAELVRRLACTWLIQMDEPMLPAVLAGTVRTVSGLSAYPPMTADLDLGADLLHCCAPGLPWQKTGPFQAVLFDAALTGQDQDEAIAQACENGVTLGFGVAPESGSVRIMLELFDRTGLEPRPLLITPPCGMIADYRPWQPLVQLWNERVG